jgi:hypothetical protein
MNHIRQMRSFLERILPDHRWPGAGCYRSPVSPRGCANLATDYGAMSAAEAAFGEPQPPPIPLEPPPPLPPI